MSISVKDIQEKEFPTQAKNGYDVESVDDFLDEISAQLSAVARENLELKNQVAQLKQDLADKEKELKEAVAKSPDYNEEGYFRNLQSAMRDSLISAQRVADEATSTARSEAEKLVSDAKIEAEGIVAEAQKNAASAKEEFESLKSAADTYRTSFRKLVEDQLNVLKANDMLFK